MQSLGKSQIRQLFPDCSAADLALPGLTHVDWGVLDYFGWLHSAGLGFVVFADSDGLKGMRLRSINARPAQGPICALGAIMFTVAAVLHYSALPSMAAMGDVLLATISAET